jgi:hypothetical protein
VDDAEHGAVGADSERQRRLAGEHPKREPQMLEQAYEARKSQPRATSGGSGFR